MADHQATQDRADSSECPDRNYAAENAHSVLDLTEDRNNSESCSNREYLVSRESLSHSAFDQSGNGKSMDSKLSSSNVALVAQEQLGTSIATSNAKPIDLRSTPGWDNVRSSSPTSSASASSVPRVSKILSVSNQNQTKSEEVTDSNHNQGPASKRPKLRQRIVATPRPLNLAVPEKPPQGCVNAFNVSEIIRDFLFVGAGYDKSNRVVTNLPNDGADDVLKSERAVWFKAHNIRFVLNVAGSIHQKETLGVTYPSAGELDVLPLDINDVPEWSPEMTEAFEAAADFIQKAHQAHIASKTDGTSGGSPAVFVHCVAGVNRSPLAVVWWLCKHHEMKPEDAWELVRKRRDVGVNWTDETLGGSIKPMVVEDVDSATPHVSPKIKWFEELKRRFGSDSCAASKQ